MASHTTEYPAGHGPHPGRCPTHPGAILREDVLPALDMSVTEAAEKLGISRQMLHGILAEKHAVTPEMAVRLGKFCGNGPGLWLRMQQNHDLWQAARDLTEEVLQIETQHVAV
jgi:antitoxin HigA-1